MSLLALTLHRPWDWAVLHAGKPVENRTWAPPAWLLNKHIAIHAGKSYDHEGAEWIRRTFDIQAPADHDLPSGVIVGVAKLVGWYQEGDGMRAPSPWAFGPCCWELEERTALATPVPCRGAQRLWKVPEPQLAEVRAQWRRVKGRAA